MEYNGLLMKILALKSKESSEDAVTIHLFS